jgi:hypothetical protein
MTGLSRRRSRVRVPSLPLDRGALRRDYDLPSKQPPFELGPRREQPHDFRLNFAGPGSDPRRPLRKGEPVPAGGDAPVMHSAGIVDAIRAQR